MADEGLRSRAFPSDCAERRGRFLFSRKNPEDGGESAHFKQLLNTGRHINQTNRSAAGLERIIGSHQRTQAGTVHIGNLAQIEQQVLVPFGRDFADGLSQGTRPLAQSQAALQAQNRASTRLPAGHFETFLRSIHS
jgi:hypothetical protein